MQQSWGHNAPTTTALSTPLTGKAEATARAALVDPRTLPAAELLRRFLQHVLPKGCITVRYDGLLSPSRRPALAQSRALLTACLSPTQAAQSGDLGIVLVAC